jgi:hypothetical protein
MMSMLKKIVSEELSVRDLEKMVTVRPAGAPAAPAKSTRRSEPYMQELEQKLMDKVGVRVEIRSDAIVIPYGTNTELTQVLRRLGVL